MLQLLPEKQHGMQQEWEISSTSAATRPMHAMVQSRLWSSVGSAELLIRTKALFVPKVPQRCDLMLQGFIPF